jgi:diguanylate cyclase (GGDEF)-like protein
MLLEDIAREYDFRIISYYDKLTGLYNRTYWDQAILGMDKPHLHPISIVIGDMNGLKLANDAFGHKQGDDMLISMADILKSVFGVKSIVARLGGDEFAVLITNTDSALTSKLCSKVRSRCVQASNEPIRLSIALGYATKTCEKATISEIMQEADDNMYRNKLNESNSIRSSIISSLRTTLEEKNIETKEHVERLKSLSLSVGRALELADSTLDELSIASDMHDIGKIGISDTILLKRDKLTEEEWTIIRKHPEIGYHIILSSPKLASIAEYILAHHERWDGKGYPRGLKEREIPLLSRIIAIADAYDAMTSSGSYRPRRTKEEALEELRRCAGTQFDPQLAEVFCSTLE